MKYLYAALVIVVLLGAGTAFVLFMEREAIEVDANIWEKVKPKKTLSDVEVSTDEIDRIEQAKQEFNSGLADYFTSVTQTRVKEKVGQPIEGFEPSMFKLAYPGMRDEDFNGVQAQQGMYLLGENGLAFENNQGDVPVHSAGTAITESGMATLLNNLAVRIDMPITTGKEIDLLLDTLE